MSSRATAFHRIADDRLQAVTPDALQDAAPAVYELYDKLFGLFTNMNQY